MVTINWATKVITVPKSFTTLIQSTPTEIRQLNLNEFRLALKDIEDDPEGMAYVDTHRHNTEVLLGGIVYARTIEIINGFTVTFEDGQYAVNLIGANSNVGDVVNVNQVSVRSANSAGLISNQAIEFSTFNNEIIIDVDNISGIARSGTLFPIGSGLAPSNNLNDAHLISDYRGIKNFRIQGNIVLSGDGIFEGHEFFGSSALRTLITVDESIGVNRCEFYDCTLTGVLDGYSYVERSIISNINYVDGFIYNCALSGTVTLGQLTIANIFDSYSSIPGLETPIINLNGSGILALRNYYGGIKLQNYTGSSSHSIDLSSGQVILDNTITSGTFVCRGIGKLIDIDGNRISSGVWNTGVTIINEFIDSKDIKDTKTLTQQIKAMTAAGL